MTTREIFTDADLEAFEVEVNDGRDVEGQQLGNDQAADHGQAERLTGFAAGAEAERDGERAHQGGHGGHHDGAETEEAALVNGDVRRSSATLSVESDINHHDGIFLDNADEHDEADEGVDVEVETEKHQREQRAEAGGGQARENRDGMDEAFVENAKNDIDDHDGHEQKDAEAFDGGLKHLGRP